MAGIMAPCTQPVRALTLTMVLQGTWSRARRHPGNPLGAPKEGPASWFLWHPPPTLADVALDELEVSRHKRSHLTHIFIAPHLTTYAWRKRLSKVCDAVFELPPGARRCWPESEHEPLLIGLTLSFSLHRPWQARFQLGFLDLVWSLREMWARAEGSERGVLRQLCNTPERMGGL
jgi:hypothetical protein